MWKLLRRVLIGLVVVVLALAAFLFGSIVVDGLLGGGRLEALANTRIPNARGPQVQAYVARPDAPGPHPAVILIHEFWGLNDDMRAKADHLAQAGYLVVVPDVFRGSTTSWVPRAIYQVVTNPAEQVNVDLDAVYAWLAEQPDVAADRIAIAGFCFGGRASLLYSLTNPRLAATVIFYGSPITEAARLRSLPGPVLGIFGGADVSIPAENVRAFDAALTEAGVPHQISIYEDQPHAFVNSVEAITQGGAQGQAWDEMLTFLKQHLQAPSSAQRRVAPALANDAFAWVDLFRLALSHLVNAH